MVLRLLLPILLAASLLAGPGRAAPKPDILDYTVSPERDAHGLVALDVTLRFAADVVGPTRLELPDQAAGASELWRYIKDLRVDGARAVQAPGPDLRLIEAEPGAPITVRYRVVSAYDHDPATPELETYKPVVRPGWFWAYGEAMFVRAQGGARRAVFHWRGPSGLPFASDLQHAAGRAMPLDDLLESVAVGGPDMTLLERAVAGAPVRVAIVGRYSFSDAEFADAATRIIAGERAFWGGREGPFLVVLAPLTPVPNSTSIRGEGRGDAFAIESSTNARLGLMEGILAHEYFHTWNPIRLGGMHDGPKEPADYWFTEGFTDFYARRLLLRMGVDDLKAFAAAWNDMLVAYDGSSARTSPGSRVLTEFWKNREVEKLPYQRGAMLAAIWDRRLRTQTKGRVGLDDIMRAMRERAKAAGDAGPKSPELFIAIAAKFGLDVRDDLARFMERGEPILLPEGVFGDCLQVRTSTVPVFDRGYESASEGPPFLVTSVKSDSAAYAGGLRQGMRIVKRETGVYGDSRKPYRLRVLDGATERVISYLPAGQRMETLQELVVLAGLPPERQRACAAEISGR